MHRKDVGEKLLKVGVVEIRTCPPQQPFKTYFGSYSPRYVDVRLLNGNPEEDEYVTRALAELVRQDVGEFSIVAGCSTAGIPIGRSLATILKKPFVYVRETVQTYGHGRYVEGMPSIAGQSVVLVDDVLMKGEKKKRFISNVEKEGGQVKACVVVLGAAEAIRDISALGYPTFSLCDIDDLMEQGRGTYFSPEAIKSLERYRKDPQSWNAKVREVMRLE